MNPARNHAVLCAVAGGLSQKAVARQFGISEARVSQLVETHARRVAYLDELQKSTIPRLLPMESLPDYSYEDTLLKAYKHVAVDGMPLKLLKESTEHRRLYSSIARHFGSYRALCEELGLDYKETMRIGNENKGPQKLRKKLKDKPEEQPFFERKYFGDYDRFKWSQAAAGDEPKPRIQVSHGASEQAKPVRFRVAKQSRKQSVSTR